MWAACGFSPRCGLMLTLATNLLMWVLAVTNDSLHREIEAELSALMEKFSGTENQAHPHRWMVHVRARTPPLPPSGEAQ